MIGVDLSALRSFAAGMGARARQISDTVARLDGVVEGLAWVGADRDRFMQEWQSHHRPAMTMLAGDLSSAGSDAHRQADRQEEASRAAGTGGSYA